MIDQYRLWQLDRSKPLTVKLGPARETTCVLCDGPLGEHEYAVNLPERCGKAHDHCAADRGFELK